MAKLTEEDYAQLENTKLGELKKLVDDCVDDYLKAVLKGMKLPGTRARKKLLHARKTLIDEIRKEIIEKRKNV